MNPRNKVLLLGTTKGGDGHARDVRMFSRMLNKLGYEHEYLLKRQLTQRFPTDNWKAVILFGNIIQIEGLSRVVMSRLGNVPIGTYAHWELPKLPRHHPLPGRDLQMFAPTRFVYHAFEKGGYRVKALPPILTGFSNRNPQASASNTFQVMCVANLHKWPERKNVIGSIHAFRRAFSQERNVRLFLKLSNLDKNPVYAAEIYSLASTDSRIAICDSPLSAQAMQAIYQQSQVYLSLHRSEGFGYTIAEAILARLPVVATSWSGSLDLTGKSAFGAVDYDLIPVDSDGYLCWQGQQWANPDTSHAAQLLRNLYDMSEADRARLAHTALIRLRKFFRADVLASHYQKAIEELVRG